MDRDLDPGAPAWFALRCSVPDAARRASVWRALRKMGALNVQRGTWLVADDPDQRAGAEELTRTVAPAEGCVEILDDLPAGEVRTLQARLRRAGDRRWDDLVDRLDEEDAGPDGRPLATRRAALGALVAEHVRLAGTDLASSPAGRRVEDRLHAAIDALADEASAAGSEPPSPSTGVRRHVRLVASWPRVDGRRVHLSSPVPLPDPWWVGCFERFEATVYTADTLRVPLRAGLFRWVADAGTEAAELARQSARVERFEATLR